MSAAIPPVVLSMILCYEVRPDPQHGGRLTAAGLRVVIPWPANRTTPLHLEQLTAILILSGGRGQGRGRISCINEETGHLIFDSEEKPINFREKDPSLPFAVRFIRRDCVFPVPGAYLARFLFEDEPIFQQSLIVR